MSSIKKIVILILTIFYHSFCQEKPIDDQSSPSSSKEKFRFEHLVKIKNEIASLGTDKSSTTEKALTIQQKEDLFKKYSFELYQLGFASFNPNVEEIKKVWKTILPDIQKDLINKPVWINNFNQKVLITYYTTLDSNWLTLLTLFIESGLDVTSELNSAKETLLHRLADINIINWSEGCDIKKIEGLIDTIIKAGAKLDAQNIQGETPLHKAYKSQNTDLVKLFIELGSNRNIPDNQGRLPRSYLIIFDNY